jgi:hypothetical protein
MVLVVIVILLSEMFGLMEMETLMLERWYQVPFLNCCSDLQLRLRALSFGEGC